MIMRTARAFIEAKSRSLIPNHETCLWLVIALLYAGMICILYTQAFQSLGDIVSLQIDVIPSVEKRSERLPIDTSIAVSALVASATQVASEASTEATEIQSAVTSAVSSVVSSASQALEASISFDMRETCLRISTDQKCTWTPFMILDIIVFPLLLLSTMGAVRTVALTITFVVLLVRFLLIEGLYQTFRGIGDAFQGSVRIVVGSGVSANFFFLGFGVALLVVSVTYAIHDKMEHGHKVATPFASSCAYSSELVKDEGGYRE